MTLLPEIRGQLLAAVSAQSTADSEAEPRTAVRTSTRRPYRLGLCDRGRRGARDRCGVGAGCGRWRNHRRRTSGLSPELGSHRLLGRIRHRR